MRQRGATLVFDLPDAIAEGMDTIFQGNNDLGSIQALHYASFCILPLYEGCRSLVIELNFDGDFRELAKSLARSALVADCMAHLNIPPQEIQERLMAANQGQGYLFVAFRGATAANIRANHALLSRSREISHELVGANARERVRSLQSHPGITPFLQMRWSVDDWLAGIGPILTAGSVVTGMLFSLIFVLGTSLGNSGHWATYTAGLIMFLTTVGLVSGTALVILTTSTTTRIPGWISSLVSSITVIVSIASDAISLHTWLMYLALLLGSVLVLTGGVSAVARTASIDRFVAAASVVISLVFSALLVLSYGGLGQTVQMASGQLLSWLVIGGLLFYSAVVYRKTSFAKGVFLGVPLAMAIAPIVPLPVVWGCSLLVWLVVLAALFAVLCLCYFEAGERNRCNEGQQVWIPGRRGTDVLLQEATRGRQLNQLASVTTIKPGRKWVLRLTLNLIMFIDSVRGTRGELSGIKTIHFARWLVIHDKLVFLSNYDHAWEAYLDEFIDQASIGLNSIWTHTTGFPLTHWLLLGGAQYAQRFKSYARQSQYPNLLHHANYPELTVRDIRQAEELRRILGSSSPTNAECEHVMGLI
ncbi:MAG: hypothetical protein ACFHX7_11910 [Pseudomonadota bacterium]